MLHEVGGWLDLERGALAGLFPRQQTILPEGVPPASFHEEGIRFYVPPWITLELAWGGLQERSLIAAMDGWDLLGERLPVEEEVIWTSGSPVALPKDPREAPVRLGWTHQVRWAADRYYRVASLTVAAYLILRMVVLQRDAVIIRERAATAGGYVLRCPERPRGGGKYRLGLQWGTDGLLAIARIPEQQSDLATGILPVRRIWPSPLPEAA